MTRLVQLAPRPQSVLRSCGLLADAVITAQTAEIEQMNKMLGKS